MSVRRNQRGGGAKPLVVLVLQGGGALGAYHVGCYQALEEAGFRPDWVAGISIGAINAALIVGNPPERRLAKLQEFWNGVARDDGWGGVFSGELRRLFNLGSAMEALVLGQPNFFSPRLPNPWLAPPGAPGATSFYDTAPLRDTLLRLVDFARVNDGEMRLSLGATKVTTGEFAFFDNRRQKIGPEHVMASGSLPPGFPAVEADGEWWWDGGCVSNTPLEAVLQDPPETDAIVFMIDLWDVNGPLPRTMDEVLWRQKQIQYASRTSQHIEKVCAELNLQHAHRMLRAAATPEAAGQAAPTPGRIEILHLIYHPTADQVSQSDAEFSRPSIADRRAAGLADMRAALAQAPWSRRTVAPYVRATAHRIVGGGEAQEATRAA